MLGDRGTGAGAVEQLLPFRGWHERGIALFVEQHGGGKGNVAGLRGNGGAAQQRCAGETEGAAEQSGHVGSTGHAARNMDGQTAGGIGAILQPLAEFALASASFANDKEKAVVGIQRPSRDHRIDLLLADEAPSEVGLLAEIHADLAEGPVRAQEEIAGLLAALGGEYLADTGRVPGSGVGHRLR